MDRKWIDNEQRNGKSYITTVGFLINQTIRSENDHNNEFYTLYYTSIL